MTEKKEARGLNISAKSFLIAIAVIFAIMVLAYAITFVIPGGQYARAEDGTILGDETFEPLEGGIPFWKWILSPVMVLTAEGSGTILAVIAFLFVIGGVFECLTKCGMMQYMLSSITHRFRGKRYVLLSVLILFFMLLGSLVGSFEECVPLVPIVVALAVNLGWDALTGLSMSLLAVGCGFAAGVFNPFTVGVAQTLAGLPMFSGALIRAVAFVLIYALLWLFTFSHARRVEKQKDSAGIPDDFVYDPHLSHGLCAFAAILGAGIVLVLVSPFVPALQDLTMIIIAVMFLVAGIVSTLICGMRGKALGKNFWRGMVGLAPAVLMILMASSVGYTLKEAHVLDTLLHGAIGLADSMPQWVVLLFIYVIVLVMNLFIASGSAKAFMLIPLVMPLALAYGIPAQLCILAFAFGDGFSNVMYPTNPVLLISLGLVDVSYGKWFRHSWKFQAANFLLTLGFLLVSLLILA